MKDAKSQNAGRPSLPGDPRLSRDELKSMMQTHRLDVGAIAAIAQASNFTVVSWLRPSGTPASRNMSRAAGVLLRQAFERLDAKDRKQA